MKTSSSIIGTVIKTVLLAVLATALMFCTQSNSKKSSNSMTAPEANNESNLLDSIFELSSAETAGLGDLQLNGTFRNPFKEKIMVLEFELSSFNEYEEGVRKNYKVICKPRESNPGFAMPDFTTNEPQKVMLCFQVNGESSAGLWSEIPKTLKKDEVNTKDFKVKIFRVLLEGGREVLKK